MCNKAAILPNIWNDHDTVHKIVHSIHLGKKTIVNEYVAYHGISSLVVLMPGTLRGQFQLWWTFWLNVSNRRLTGQLKIVWMKGQIPPGGMDVSFIMPSLTPLTFDALASRSRIWASSLKGLSLYSVCSQSLNCTNTERHNKKNSLSDLLSPACPTPHLPGCSQTPGAGAGSPRWGRRRVGRPSLLRVRRSSPAPSLSWCRRPLRWHFGRHLPDCRMEGKHNIS